MLSKTLQAEKVKDLMISLIVAYKIDINSWTNKSNNQNLIDTENNIAVTKGKSGGGG